MTWFELLIFSFTGKGEEEGQPQSFLVRATFSLFSRQSHLEESKSSPFKKKLFKCPRLEDIEFSFANLKFVKKVICFQNDVLQIIICLQCLPFFSKNAANYYAIQLKQLFLFLQFNFTHISLMI